MCLRDPETRPQRWTVRVTRGTGRERHVTGATTGDTIKERDRDRQTQRTETDAREETNEGTSPTEGRVKHPEARKEETNTDTCQ